MKKFTSTDAWVLQTIALASEQKIATLKEIIATADYLNHAILSPGELQLSLYKLSESNYIENKEDGFYLTNSAKKILAPILKKRKSIMKQQDEIVISIGASNWDPDVPLSEYSSNLIPIFFTLEEFKNACEEYHKVFKGN